MEIEGSLVLSARAGNEDAMTEVLGKFEGYIKKWAHKELGSFLGTWMDLHDIENLLRERVWVAMKKYDPEKHKSFWHRAIGYMRGGMWAKRNELHRNMRMQKVENIHNEETHGKYMKRKRTKLETGGSIITMVEAKAPKYRSLITPVFSVLMDEAKGDNFEVSTLIKALRVEIDFDFNIFYDQLHDELAKKDPFLPTIFKMLHSGFKLGEIANHIGIEEGEIKNVIETHVIPVAAIMRAEEIALVATKAPVLV